MPSDDWNTGSWRSYPLSQYGKSSRYCTHVIQSRPHLRYGIHTRNLPLLPSSHLFNLLPSYSLFHLPLGTTLLALAATIHLNLPPHDSRIIQNDLRLPLSNIPHPLLPLLPLPTPLILLSLPLLTLILN